MALFASGCGGVVDSAAHAWKKGIGKKVYPVASFTIGKLEEGYTETAYVTISDEPSDLKWGNELLFDRIAVCADGVKLKFGTTHYKQPTMFDCYDLFRESSPGVFGELLGSWLALEAGGAHYISISSAIIGAEMVCTMELDPMNEVEFKEFVISSDSTEYPEDGPHNDGYYYVKIDYSFN